MLHIYKYQLFKELQILQHITISRAILFFDLFHCYKKTLACCKYSTCNKRTENNYFNSI